jgi:GntR family transcriptional regulator
MKIDPRSHVPIYRQIAEEVRAAVAAGIYRPGEVLPSLRAMAVEIQVNPNTVQRAYDELEREGLIYSQRGRGLFVCEQGTASAQLTAGDGVRRSFDEAIRASLAAGMKTRQIREIFHAALAQMSKANESASERRPTEKMSGGKSP